MYNTPTQEALKIVKQLKENLKEHYYDNKTKRDEYLLSKANLELDTGKEEKVKAIRDIKKVKRRNQCYRNFLFHQGTGISAQEINQIQTPKSRKIIEEHVEDAEFKWIDPKQVDKDNDSLWRAITIQEEIELFFLKQNLLHFGQSEH